MTPESHSLGSLELYTWGFVHLLLLGVTLATASHPKLYDELCVCTAAQVLGQCSDDTSLVAAVTAFLIFP